MKTILNSGRLNTGSNGLLSVANQIADRSAVEGSLFSGYVFIYGQLVNEADRRTTDRFIQGTAEEMWKSSKGNADYLSVISPLVPGYGAEIMQARDRVRELQALFSCADEAVGKEK